MRPQETSFWWSVTGEWVEEPNNRRGGFSGVPRVVLPQSGECYYVKRQRNHLFRSVRYPTGRPKLLREWQSMPSIRPNCWQRRSSASVVSSSRICTTSRLAAGAV